MCGWGLGCERGVRVCIMRGVVRVGGMVRVKL